MASGAFSALEMASFLAAQQTSKTATLAVANAPLNHIPLLHPTCQLAPANRELAAAPVAVARRQASAELLLDRALESIEHLREVAQSMTLWMDGLLNA